MNTVGMESFGSSFRDIYISLYEDKERSDQEYVFTYNSIAHTDYIGGIYRTFD